MIRSPISLHLGAAALLVSVGILHVGPAEAQSEKGSGAGAGARIVYNTAGGGSDPDVTIDIFWCADDDQAANRSLAASEIAATWGVIAKLDTARPSLPTAVVRTRPIDIQAFRNGVSAEDLEVAKKKVLLRYDETDDTSRIFIDRVIFSQEGLTATLPTQRITSIKNTAFTPRYVSAFVCTNVDTAVVSGRLFFQVKEAEQKPGALEAAAVLRKELPGLTVIRDVEVVGEKAPSNNELRYFYETDADLAARTAESISSTTSTRVEVKRIPGFESKVRRGTLEAWITGTR